MSNQKQVQASMSRLMSMEEWQIVKNDWIALQKILLQKILDESLDESQRKILVLKHNFLDMIINTPNNIHDEFYAEVDSSGEK